MRGEGRSWVEKSYRLLRREGGRKGITKPEENGEGKKQKERRTERRGSESGSFVTARGGRGRSEGGRRAGKNGTRTPAGRGNSGVDLFDEKGKATKLSGGHPAQVRQKSYDGRAERTGRAFPPQKGGRLILASVIGGGQENRSVQGGPDEGTEEQSEQKRHRMLIRQESPAADKTK